MEKNDKEEGGGKKETTPAEEGGAEKKEETSDLVKEAKETAKEIKEQNDRKEKLIEAENKILDRKEALNALGGGSPAGTKSDKPKKLTDTEYAEALEKGKVNPLKEDGLI